MAIDGPGCGDMHESSLVPLGIVTLCSWHVLPVSRVMGFLGSSI
jgi:hypothetical protein